MATIVRGFMIASLASLWAVGLGSFVMAQSQDIDPQYVTVSGPRFANPVDLILSRDKSLLFVADLGNDSIKVLDPKTLQTIDIIGRGDLNAPHDVALDNRGRLLVADTGNHRIVVFRVFGTKGKAISVWDKGFLNPKSVAVDTEGAVYITNMGHHNIMKLVNGDVVKQVGGEGKGPNQFIRPHDIEFDSKGRLYVADPGNNRIKILDKNLNFIRELKGPPFNFKEPRYIKFDLNDWLYVADAENHQIKIFDDKLKFRGKIGDGNPSKKRGKLRAPEGVEVLNNNIWVSDTYNSRVQLYRR